MKYIYIYSFINSLILIIHTRKNNLISSCIINIKRNLSYLIPFLAHFVNNETLIHTRPIQWDKFITHRLKIRIIVD